VEAALGPTAVGSLSDLVCSFCVFSFFIASGFAQNIFDGLSMMCSFDILILSKGRTSILYTAVAANW